MSASVITGAGTPSSIDSRAVPRPSRDAREFLAPRQDLGAKVEQPGAHHAAVAPGLGEARRVDVELGARREQREALRERLHDPVLDAVVDHLREVAGAARPAVQPADLGAWREQARERLEDLDRYRRAAEHEAIALLEPVHSAGDARVDVAQSLLRQCERAAHGVPVVAVAAVDQRVAGGDERHEAADRVLDGGNSYYR